VTPLVFIGDDFTGSTDALESYSLLGRSVRLFTRLEHVTDAIAKHESDVVGLATTTRAQSPQVMSETLVPVFEAFRRTSVERVHYKCCSTFDSAPHVGSLGRVIDLATQSFGDVSLPIIGAAPALGRYCVFGHLFARSADGLVYRIDRHPSMSKHPSTPMAESDLRLHLSKQTSRPIALVDLVSLRAGASDLGTGATLIDGLDQHDLTLANSLVNSSKACLIVGGSGGCEVIVGNRSSTSLKVDPAKPMNPLLVVAGSCSPATGAQIDHALANGFVEAIVRSEDDVSCAIDMAARACSIGHSIVIHTDSHSPVSSDVNPPLARALESILQRSSFAAVLLCGGDTSGTLATSLGVESIERVASTVRGVPLCRVRATRPFLDGQRFLFKGGQIGPSTFFTDVRDGTCS
jgi:3-oxoisoapionate kinase